MARIGDIDHDGRRDLIVGASDAGYAQVFSAATGALLFTLTSAGGCNSVADAGDVDADGTPDIAIGEVDFSVAYDIGRAQVFSGATGAVLHTFHGSFVAEYFGCAVAGAGDWDHDGHADVFVGEVGSQLGSMTPGAVHLYSGASGTELAVFSGQVGGDAFGADVASTDLDGDGVGDLLAGAPATDVGGNASGSLQVFLSGTPEPSVYCTAKLNSLGCLPTISCSGAASLTIGDNFAIGTRHVLNQQPGILFFGLGSNAAPFLGGVLCVAQPLQRTPPRSSGGSPSSITDCSGSFELHFSQGLMNGFGLAAGTTIVAQFWSRDVGLAAPYDASLTNAVRFAVGP